jgi:tetratricopeptide (TPR) repeat protein
MAELGFEFTHFGEFAWAFFEPSDGTFDFAWLDRALGLAEKHGLKVILCTPTPCPPAWLGEKFPEIYLVRGDGLLATAPVVLALLVLTPITWARNAEWSNEVVLLEHDYRHGVRTGASLRLLTSAHLLQRNPARAVEICRENENVQLKSGHLRVHCGTAYALSGDAQRAEQAFLRAAGHEVSRTRAHSNLARLYVTQGRRDEARAQFEIAIESEVHPATRAYRKVLMLVQLYPQERGKLLEARAHFEEALRLQPRLTLAINALDQVDRSLGQLP